MYFGTEDWDGPLNLHDMLDTDNKALLKYVEDYKINLIVFKDVIDSEKFSTDFREVIDFLKVSQNKKALKELMDSRSEEFSNMEPETAQLLKECANVKIKRSTLQLV